MRPAGLAGRIAWQSPAGYEPLPQVAVGRKP
jgi:hypothetical protein